MDFKLTKQTETELYTKELRKFLADEGVGDLLPYEQCRGFSFSIVRHENDKNDGYDLCIFSNAIKCYIDVMTEVYILTFTHNYEQPSGDGVVRMEGAPCLIEQIRNSLNGVIAKQIKGAEYELHVVNDTPRIGNILTDHITLKGGGDHDNFAKGISLGTIEPGSELHIDSIYMDGGSGFTSVTSSFVNNTLTVGNDSTHYTHNGWTSFYDPDMEGEDIFLRGPGVIEMEIPPQPYKNPKDILIEALMMMKRDIMLIADHEKLSRDQSDDEHYEYNRCLIRRTGGDVYCVLRGFILQLGVMIANFAPVIYGDAATHYTAHWECVTKKNMIIRLSGPSDIFEKCIAMALHQVKNIMGQIEN